jgi:hypothetical protein
MFYYIQKNLPKNYLVYKTEMKTTNRTFGSTLEDYKNGCYILLNDEQIAFALANPNASAIEILNMELTPTPTLTLAEVKELKIQEINNYDNSESVNNFKINDVINAWFTVSERNNYSSSIAAAKTVGVDNLTFFVGDVKLEIATAMAELMLAQIQLYADQCFIVTKQHKINVEALSTIEEVENYNYKVGYPEQLNFQLG